MKKLRLTLTAREPLVITSGSAESMAHECLGYVPGNMILGALASNWIRLHPDALPDDDPVFRRLFLDGDVSYGHALPLCEGQSSVPVPLSYMRPKNHPSLPREGEKTDDQIFMVFNMLAIKNDENAEKNILDILWKKKHSDSEKCPKLKKMPETFLHPGTLHLVNEKKVWNMHVALARQRSAVNEQLFGYSALAAGTMLASEIICTDEAAKDLEALLARLKNISVGHARSAGYGLGDITREWEKKGAAGESGKECGHTLFLLSQYLPFPSWENPLDNFCQSLCRKFGKMPKIERQHVNYQEIQGYNNLWKRPRDSRQAMCMGSVLRVNFPGPVALPCAFELGAGQIEGYGRILVDPEFLKKDLPDIGQTCVRATSQKAIPQGDDPILRLLRQRALERLREELVRQWLHTPEWQKFLESAPVKLPTASQRNSLRDADKNRFEKMLEKTPGAQWKNAVAYSPFRNGKDHLDQIMLKLLNLDEFKKMHAKDFTLPDDLPGTLTTDEKDAFAIAAHKLFLRQLVALWNKKANSGEK